MATENTHTQLLGSAYRNLRELNALLTKRGAVTGVAAGCWGRLDSGSHVSAGRVRCIHTRTYTLQLALPTPQDFTCVLTKRAYVLDSSSGFLGAVMNAAVIEEAREELRKGE